jgi:hypothetical protein
VPPSDPAALRAFLHAVFAYLDHSHSVPLRAMLRGVIQVAVFLDSRTNGDELAAPERFRNLTNDLHKIT